MPRRTRLLRPDFFLDARMASLPPGARLLYQALWCAADDSGYLDWEPAELAAFAMPYDGSKLRQRVFIDWSGRLIEMGRIVMLECGLHAIIPSLPASHLAGGHMSHTVRKRHEDRCLSRLVRTGLDKSVSNLGLNSGLNSGRSGAFDEAMQAAGVDPSLTARRRRAHTDPGDDPGG